MISKMKKSVLSGTNDDPIDMGKKKGQAKNKGQLKNKVQSKDKVLLTDNVSKAFEKGVDKRPVIRKEIMNIIRTTYRNNIDLTNIADNKANILLSLNSLMITFLIPIVLANLQIIQQEKLYLPLITLALTCLTTIIIAAMATRPIRMGKQNVTRGERTQTSPFFFGNYYKMEAEEYLETLEETIMDPHLVKEYIKLDLYFMGRGLGDKYSKIRTCYNVFIGGLIWTVIAFLLVVIL